MPSHLPYLRQLNLQLCNSVCDESLEELVTAAPELEVIDYYGERVVAGMIESSNNRSTEEGDAMWSSADEEGH
jgi:hypothetical protein